MSSTDVKSPCPNESIKPCWLEAQGLGTQGFRVSEKKVPHGRKIVVTPEKDQQGSSIKSFLRDSEHSESPQIYLSQEDAMMRPDHTSTPAQPKPVKARHLTLHQQSLEPMDFIEPIALAHGVKVDERYHKGNSGPHEKDVSDIDSCDDYKSDVSEYSSDSAEDPFDIICSPVNKAHRRKKHDTSKNKVTLRTSKLKSKEAVPSNPINYVDEKSNKDPVLMEVVGSETGILLTACTNNNMHNENINMSEEKSICKDGFPLNKGKSEGLVNTDPKVKLFSEEPTGQMSCYQAEGGYQTPPPGKYAKVLLTKTKNVNVSDSTSLNKHYIKMPSSEHEKESISLSCSKQKRKTIEIPALYKKRKLSKGFVYPSDIGEGYKELNVSYTETIGGDERWNKTVVPVSKGVTCNTPTNNSLCNEKLSEAVVPESKGATCSTPITRMEDERWFEAVKDSKGTTCNTPVRTVDESWLTGEMADDKRAMCINPATHTKATEEVHISAVSQKNFLPLLNLDIRDTLSSKPSFELLKRPGYDQMASSVTILKTPVDTKESIGNARQHCTLRVVPVASVPPCESECTNIAGKKGSLVTYNADINKLQENMSNIYNTPSRNLKRRSIRTKCDITSNIDPVLSREQKGQCQMDLLEPKVLDFKSMEGLTTQGNERQNKYVSSSLKSQLVGDTFSDIDFSDSDFDISLPLGERSATDDDKNMKPDKDNDVFTKAVHGEEIFDGNPFNRINSERDSGFIGFMTGCGKQVKVSDKALEQARKLLEEQTSEEQSLGSQQVPSGESVSNNYSDTFHVKRETCHMTSCLPVTTNSDDNTTVSEKGFLTILSNEPSIKGASKLKQQIHNENTSSFPEVNSSFTQELIQTGFVRETSSESTRLMKGIITPRDGEESKGSVRQDSRNDLNRDLNRNSVTNSIQLKAKKISEHFDTGRNAEEDTSKMSGRAPLLYEENNSWMCSGGDELMEGTEKTTKRPLLEPKSDAFQGFSTAAGSRIKVTKEALRKAQMLWEEGNADTSMQASVNMEMSKQYGYTVLAEDQSVGLKMSAIPAELMATKGVLKNEGAMVDHRNKSEQCMSSRTLETTFYSSNDCSSLNQTCDFKKLPKTGLPSVLVDEVKCDSIRATDYQSGSLSLVASHQVSEKEANTADISFPTLPTVNEPCSFRESICKDVPNTLEMAVGFHTAKGKKVSVNEASVAQARSLWKETVSHEVIKPQQQHNSASDHEVHEEMGVGFHTAKGKKISFNKTSILQARLLWKETASSDLEAAQEQQTTTKHLNNDISRKLINKPDGRFFASMNAVPKSHSLQINSTISNPSSSKRLSVKEMPTEEEEFATSNTKMSGRRSTCETNINPQLRIADSITVFNTDSSTDNEDKVYQSVNLMTRPRKLFENEMHSTSVMKYQSPNNRQNNDDLENDGKSESHRRKVDTVEGRVMYVPETVVNKSGTASYALCTDPFQASITQHTISRLSVEEALHATQKMKDLQQSTETNVFLNTKQSENVQESASQKMDIDFHTKSTDIYETINLRENSLLEDKIDDVSEFTVCGFSANIIKPVTVSNKSLQQPKQLLNNKGSSENTNKPSFVVKKSNINTNKRQITTVESFVVTADQNSENTDDENHEVICGSPILGSQRTNKKKNVKNMCSVAANQELKIDSINSQETSDISDVTEAFLKDCLLDCEDTKGPSSQRKRLRRLCQNEEEDSLAHEKIKRNVMFNPSKNLQGNTYKLLYLRFLVE